MAIADTSSDSKNASPDAKEAPSLASSVSTAAKESPITPRPKFDIGRPFRYLSGFVGGTFNSTLNGMANGGRKGMWLGTGIGLLSLMTGVSIFGLSIAAGWAGGLLIGALAGGTVGLVTGGIRGMGRESRKDKYADELLVKARAKSQPIPHADYREARREYKTRSDYTLDRIYQQQRENAYETKTFFQDHVHHSRMGHHERGF